MEFRHNILFSLILHTTFILFAFLVHSRGTAFRVPDQYMEVSLLTGLTDTESPAVKTMGNNKITRKVSHAKVLMKEIPRNPSRKKTDGEIAHLPENVTTDNLSGVETGDEEGGDLETDVSEQSQVMVAITTLDSSKENGSLSISTSLVTSKGIPAYKGTGFINVDTHSHGNSNTIIMKTIRDAIEKAIIYPPIARKRGIEGTVTAEFTINNKGYPENIKIVYSSGFNILDSAAKNTIVKAAPFPVVKGDIEVPITFRLRKDN